MLFKTNLTLKKNHFKHSIIYAGVNGNYQNLIIDENHFEGPSNHNRNIPNFNAISTFEPTNTIKVINNRIHDYQYAGMHILEDNALIKGNTVYNNGQDTEGIGYFRVGINSEGDNSVITNNIVYDNQGTKTQTYASIRAIGDEITVSNNYGDIDSFMNGSGWKKTGNTGGILDTVRFLATMTAGNSTLNIDALADALNIPVNLTTSRYFTAQQLNNGSNGAISSWFRVSGGVLYLELDSNVTVDTNFLIKFDYTSSID